MTNIYAPDDISILKEKLAEIDEMFEMALNAFVQALTHKVSVFGDEERLDKVEESLYGAEELAKLRETTELLMRQNLVSSISLRRAQLGMVADMFRYVKDIPDGFTGGGRLADLLESSSNKLADVGAVLQVEMGLEKLKDYMENMDLSKNNEERLIQSNIYQTFKEFERFMDIGKEVASKSLLAGDLQRVSRK